MKDIKLGKKERKVGKKRYAGKKDIQKIRKEERMKGIKESKERKVGKKDMQERKIGKREG